MIYSVRGKRRRWFFECVWSSAYGPIHVSVVRVWVLMDIHSDVQLRGWVKGNRAAVSARERTCRPRGRRDSRSPAKRKRLSFNGNYRPRIDDDALYKSDGGFFLSLHCPISPAGRFKSIFFFFVEKFEIAFFFLKVSVCVGWR